MFGKKSTKISIKLPLFPNIWRNVNIWSIVDLPAPQPQWYCPILSSRSNPSYSIRWDWGCKLKLIYVQFTIVWSKLKPYQWLLMEYGLRLLCGNYRLSFNSFDYLPNTRLKCPPLYCCTTTVSFRAFFTSLCIAPICALSVGNPPISFRGVFSFFLVYSPNLCGSYDFVVRTLSTLFKLRSKF